MQFIATEEDAGKRLDRFLAGQMPETSRARIQEWIRAERVQVDGSAARPSRLVEAGDKIDVEPAPAQPLHAFAEDIPLDILYEDDDLAAINKPAGMTVHAGAGMLEGTLVNALLHHFKDLSGLGGDLRPGIVHRLDRFTSGVMLVAKNDQAHQQLARQFESRKIEKAYWAVVEGQVSESDLTGGGRLAGRGIYPRRVEADGFWWVRLDMPIRRDPHHRIKMTATPPRGYVRHPADRFDEDDPEPTSGRSARSDLRVLQTSPRYSLLEVRIATGRTHQIRVHLSAIGHPVVGDRLYGGAALPAGSVDAATKQPADPPPAPQKGATRKQKTREPQGSSHERDAAAATSESDSPSSRFLLHSRRIGLAHPVTGERLLIEAPLPDDFDQFLKFMAV